MFIEQKKNVIASVVTAEPLKSLIDTAWRQHSRTVKMTSESFKLVFNTEGEEGDKTKSSTVCPEV